MSHGVETIVTSKTQDMGMTPSELRKFTFTKSNWKYVFTNI